MSKYALRACTSKRSRAARSRSSRMMGRAQHVDHLPGSHGAIMRRRAPARRLDGGAIHARYVHPFRLDSLPLVLYSLHMKSTISSKGQITVPVEIRERLGLRAGTPVVFEARPDGALMRKALLTGHPVDSLFGSLRVGTSVDATLDALRGPRPRRRAARKAGKK